MRYVNYTLRPLTIDNAKPREKAYALTDGGGLLLEVLPSPGWQQKRQQAGIERTRQVVERTRSGPEMER